jgi:hypothetical protein
MKIALRFLFEDAASHNYGASILCHSYQNLLRNPCSLSPTLEIFSHFSHDSLFLFLLLFLMTLYFLGQS